MPLSKCKWNLQDREVKRRKYLEGQNNSYMILVTCRKDIRLRCRSARSVKVYNKFLEMLGTIWQKCQLIRQILVAENSAEGAYFVRLFFASG
jgi:hypothetical protein